MQTLKYLSLAALVVVSPTNFSSVTLPTTGSKTIFYDAERRAVVMFHTDSTQIERYYFDGTTWQHTSVSPTFYTSGMAMSPDGKKFVVLTQDNLIVWLDPVTLTNITSTNVLTDLNSIAIANDGFALILSGGLSGQIYRYSLLDNSLTPQNGGTLGGTLSSFGRATGDGSRIIYPTGETVYYYDAGSSTLSPSSLSTGGTLLNVNRTGSRMLFNRASVYNENFTYLADIPYDNVGNFSCLTDDAILSQDGTRAYAYCSIGTSGRLYTYDLTAAPVNRRYPAIGSFFSVPYPMSRMAISPDRKTFFIVNTSSLFIQPLP